MSVTARAAKIAVTGVVIVLALVTILTALRTELPRSPGVMSDALGPDSGEAVADYLDRAEASLAEDGEPGATDRSGRDDTPGYDEAAPDSDPEAPRWALVTAATAWTAAEAEAGVRDLPRVSALLVQVPVDGVAMPVTETVLVEPVAGESSRGPAFERALERTAERLDGRAPGASGGAFESVTGADPAAPGADSERASATAALTASRIRSGAPAVIGMVVRGTPAQLRALAREPGVRAVEALPADAVWGRFAVRPLLPQQQDLVTPLPDSGPVPAG